MSQFICPSCGQNGCNHMIQPGAAMPIAIVCDLTTPPIDTEFEQHILCDEGNNNHAFISRVRFDENGDLNPEATGTFELDGTTAYTLVGPAILCAEASEMLPVCFTTTLVPGVVKTGYKVVSSSGTTLKVKYYFDTSAISYTVATVTEIPCLRDIDPVILCDDNGQFVRHYSYNDAGQIGSFADTTFDNVTYTPVGTVKLCAPSVTSEFEILCDDNMTFVRRFDKDDDGNITFADTTLDGITVYIPVGTIKVCFPTVTSEFVTFCDDNITFLRRYDKDDTGVITIINTLLDGTTAYTPVGTIGVCNDNTLYDSKILCDNNGSFLRRYAILDGVVTFADTTLSNTAYTVVGPVTSCKTAGVTTVITDCENVGHPVITIGANLLENGDFQRSTGIGATTVAGPGWTSGYLPSSQIFAAGVNSYGFFTTNAGQITGNNAAAVPIQALTTRSIAVNVGPNVAIPIISWPNIFLENNVSYALDVDAAIIFGPFGVSINIDGVAVVPVVAPNVAGVWRHTQTVFTYTGVTGYHTVALHSNNAPAAGNDHCFDSFALRKVSNSVAEVRTNTNYNDTIKAVIPHIVETAGCFDSRRDELLGQILNKASLSGYIVPICAAGVTMLRVVDEKNVVTFLSTNGTFVAAPAAYTIGECSGASTVDFLVLCDDNGQFLRRYNIDTAGVVTLTNTTIDGTTAYTPVGVVEMCSYQSLVPSVQRLAGIGTINIATNAKSVTVTVVTGNPTVTIGATAAVTLPTGISLTWSGDFLGSAFVFTGTATTDFIVTTVR